MTLFNSERLTSIDHAALSFPAEIPFPLTEANVKWAESINLFSSDVGLLRSDYVEKAKTAPSIEAASFLIDVVFRRLKKKVIQLDVLLSRGVSLGDLQLSKLEEIKDFHEFRDELLSLVSPENKANPLIRKIFG